MRDVECLTPLLVVDGSGGLADLIADCWSLLHDDQSLASSHSRPPLEIGVRRVFPQFLEQAHADEMLRRVFNVVAVAHKVTVFNMATSDGEDFDKAILDTVTHNLRAQLANKGGAETRALSKEGVKKRKLQLKLGAEYELFMDLLRLALTFDRVDEATSMLTKAYSAWDKMKCVGHILLTALPTPAPLGHILFLRMCMRTPN